MPESECRRAQNPTASTDFFPMPESECRRAHNPLVYPNAITSLSLGSNIHG
ncbi:MAG: hypothetical protein QNJ63_24325 [Calothrix sp. MO_192.B10]|nr:hypothetical protein [Calothrix sp. MO_192.B10]